MKNLKTSINKIFINALVMSTALVVNGCFEQKNSSLKKGTELPSLNQNGSVLPSGGDKNSLLGVADEVESINTKTLIITLNSEDYTQYILLENSSVDEKVQGAKKQQVFVFLHGGEWNSGSIEDHAFINTLTEADSANIAVVKPSYRPTLPENAAATGQMPLSFDSQDARNKFPMQVQDVDCSLRWIAANATKYKFDLDNIYIGGISSGGHLALLVSLNKEDAYKNPKCPYASTALPKIKKVIAIAAQTNLKTFNIASDSALSASSEIDLNSFKNAFIDSDVADLASPIKFIDKTKTDSNKDKEFLLIYSKADKVVDYNTQFIPFYKMMYDNRFKIASMVFNSADHFFSTPDNVNYASYIISAIKAFIENDPIIENAQLFKEGNDEASTTYKLKIKGINFNNKMKIAIRTNLMEDGNDPSFYTLKFIDSSNMELEINNELKEQLVSVGKIYISILIPSSNKEQSDKESNIKIVSTVALKDQSDTLDSGTLNQPLEDSAGFDNSLLEASDKVYAKPVNLAANVKTYTSDSSVVASSKSLTKKAELLAKAASSSKSSSSNTPTCTEGNRLVGNKCVPNCQKPLFDIVDLSNTTKCTPISTMPGLYNGNITFHHIANCDLPLTNSNQSQQACRYECNSGYIKEYSKIKVSINNTGYKYTCVKIKKIANSVKSSNSKCPDNYAFVKADPTVGVTKDFCVMKYKAKIDCPTCTNSEAISSSSTAYKNLGRAVSRPEGKAYLLNKDLAFDKCKALGKGYSLISNAEWMNIARNIEKLNRNWASGKRGEGVIFLSNFTYGNSASTGGAVSDPTNPYSDTSTRIGFDPTRIIPTESGPIDFRRISYLSETNDLDILWDFAAVGMGEWVDMNLNDSKITGIDCISPYQDYVSYAGHKCLLDRNQVTSAFNYDHTQGMGFFNYNSRFASHVIRGGYGLFHIELVQTHAKTVAELIGFSFRCVYRF